MYVHVCIYTHASFKHIVLSVLLSMFVLIDISTEQGGEDPQDALSLQVIFRNRALQLVALLRKMTCNLRHPTGLRHPISVFVLILYVRLNIWGGYD